MREAFQRNFAELNKSLSDNRTPPKKSEGGTPSNGEGNNRDGADR